MYLRFNDIEDLLFDELPEELQYGIADIADEQSCDIDTLWIDIQMGDVLLPSNLKRQLSAEIKKKVGERL